MEANKPLCEICNQLRDQEGGCARASEDAELLPPAAARLVGVDMPSWAGALEKCPLCGTYYSYIHYYEYAPAGIEEETHLQRLSTSEAVAALIGVENYPELSALAQRSAADARLVLHEINRSRLKRASAEFQALQALCRRWGKKSIGV